LPPSFLFAYSASYDAASREAVRFRCSATPRRATIATPPADADVVTA
jgi:hypothetical protein